MKKQKTTKVLLRLILIPHEGPANVEGMKKGHTLALHLPPICHTFDGTESDDPSPFYNIQISDCISCDKIDTPMSTLIKTLISHQIDINLQFLL